MKHAGGIDVGVSIGVASSDAERDAEGILRSADRAMYRVKAVHRRARRAATESPSFAQIPARDEG
jgi:GGDEF domain-containing protein